MKKFILTYFLTLIFCCFNWYAKAQVFPVPKTESETSISNFSTKTHPVGENIVFKGANLHTEQNSQFRAPCVDCSWEWSTEITIDNSFGASPLTNYEVMLTIDTQSFIAAGQMNADGSDIRFTGNDPCSVFPYYIESGINTAATVIWVNVPNIGAGGSETIYMYHGNSTATSTSDPETTFSFWEGFDDALTNFGTSCGSYTATVAGGNLDMSWSSNGVLISDTTFPVSEVFTAEAQVNSASGNWPGIYWAKETAAKSYAMLTGGSTQVRISKTGASGGFCTGHNWASPLVTYTNASGIWSLTWQDTGNIFGEFPTVGLITSTDTEHAKDENLKLNIGGISSGSGSIQMDWIRARKYTATPPSSSIGATVTNVDTTPPTIACPGDITQDNDPGECGANVTVPIPIVTESCPSSVATVINGPNTPFIFDDSGAPFEPLLDTPSTIENVSVATSDVSLDITFSGYFYSNDNCFDLEGPDGSQVYFGCNLNVLCSEIVMVNATITEATWNSWIGSYGTDLTFVLKADPDVVDLSCGGVQEAYQLTANYNIADYNLTNDFNGTADASGFYPIGTTTVIWTTTDASGNTATCTMSVTVNDTEAPEITCPGNITQDNDSGECGAIVTYADPTVSDNCSTGLPVSETFFIKPENTVPSA
ncbi:MAG TPA: DUF2341 domain-containing protein, partial [Aequorivita sp.]|nr:DUF2341 domain-containing protein [Aequorivita sp.]